MTKQEWIALNQRTRPIMKELTDEFIELCEKEPDNILMRMAEHMGLPEGVDPSDERILRIFKVTD
jgi:hypothetical protein